jgi:hypothetical protein
MLTIRRANERGHANHGWLDAHHTFSFAGYHHPDFVHFGALRVLNQDGIAPGMGFPTHSHDNMEIVTYVLEGSLRHEDSMGNGSLISPGEVQLMSAGTGVAHSEFNNSPSEPLHLLQMWVFPEQRNTTPRYEQKDFGGELGGKLRLVVAPDGRDGSLQIGQDARLFAGHLGRGDTAELELPTGRSAWLHLAAGKLEVNGVSLEGGDGVAVIDEPTLQLEQAERASVVVWELREAS